MIFLLSCMYVVLFCIAISCLASLLCLYRFLPFMQSTKSITWFKSLNWQDMHIFIKWIIVARKSVSRKTFSGTRTFDFLHRKNWSWRPFGSKNVFWLFFCEMGRHVSTIAFSATKHHDFSLTAFCCRGSNGGFKECIHRISSYLDRVTLPPPVAGPCPGRARAVPTAISRESGAHVQKNGTHSAAVCALVSQFLTKTNGVAPKLS